MMPASQMGSRGAPKGLRPQDLSPRAAGEAAGLQEPFRKVRRCGGPGVLSYAGCLAGPLPSRAPVQIMDHPPAGTPCPCRSPTPRGALPQGRPGGQAVAGAQPPEFLSFSESPLAPCAWRKAVLPSACVGGGHTFTWELGGRKRRRGGSMERKGGGGAGERAGKELGVFWADLGSDSGCVTLAGQSASLGLISFV